MWKECPETSFSPHQQPGSAATQHSQLGQANMCHQYASAALKKKLCLQTKINLSQTLSVRMSRAQAEKMIGYLETALYMEHKLKTSSILF